MPGTRRSSLCRLFRTLCAIHRRRRRSSRTEASPLHTRIEPVLQEPRASRTFGLLKAGTLQIWGRGASYNLWQLAVSAAIRPPPARNGRTHRRRKSCAHGSRGSHPFLPAFVQVTGAACGRCSAAPGIAAVRRTKQGKKQPNRTSGPMHGEADGTCPSAPWTGRTCRALLTVRSRSLFEQHYRFPGTLFADIYVYNRSDHRTQANTTECKS